MFARRSAVRRAPLTIFRPDTTPGSPVLQAKVMFHTLAASKLFAVKVLILPLLATAWWLTPGAIDTFVHTIFGVATSCAVTYISISALVEKWRKEKTKGQLEDRIAEMKALDEARKTTLSGQLAEMTENQELMRKTLHSIRDDLQARTLENTELRDDLHTAHEDSAELSRQLVEANKRIEILTARLNEANQRIAAFMIQVGNINRDAAERNREIKDLVNEVHETVKAATDSGTFPALPSDLPKPA